MKLIVVIFGYLKWHYSKALKSIVSIWKNFLTFLINFFSLKLIVRNLFDPWKRMADSYPSRFDFKSYVFSFITNIIMRIVGIVMRLLLLVVGLGGYILFCLLLPIIFVVWLFLPLITIFLIISGLYLIIK